MDITPLYKYEINGIDSGRFVSRIMARNVEKMKVGQVFYSCWCDDFGKVIDDGTVFRLEENRFQVNAGEPMLAWFSSFIRGFDVTIEDITDRIAALSIQGPTSRDILKQISDIDFDSLSYFQGTRGKLDDLNVYVSRTGYTGDLGYEIWVQNRDALRLWDALMSAGMPYLLRPAGLDALDIARIEAGLILTGVDFHNANHCLAQSRKSTPYELGLGWTVDLDRQPFCGQRALEAEREAGSRYALVGLELDWEEIEALYEKHGLPAQVSGAAWRYGVPVYNRGARQIGKATSGVWSPMAKKNLALASVEAQYAQPGTELRIEHTVEYQREKVTAMVAKMPFYNPDHKKA
jgi:aminomethyltransferase